MHDCVVQMYCLRHQTSGQGWPIVQCGPPDGPAPQRQAGYGDQTSTPDASQQTPTPVPAPSDPTTTCPGRPTTNRCQAADPPSHPPGSTRILPGSRPSRSLPQPTLRNNHTPYRKQPNGLEAGAGTAMHEPNGRRQGSMQDNITPLSYCGLFFYIDMWSFLYI